MLRDQALNIMATYGYKSSIIVIVAFCTACS